MPPRRLARLLSVLLAVLLLSVGLPGTAQAASRAPVVTARVVDTEGHAVPGAVVELTDGVGGLASFVEALVCALTFAVLYAPEACGPHTASARSDSAGRVRVPLRAGSPLARARTFTVRVQARSKALLTTSRPRTASLGDLPLWQPTLRRERAGRRTRPQVSVPEGASERPVLRFRAAGEADVAWAVTLDEQGRADVDDRVLEQRQKAADSRVDGTLAGRDATWYTPSLPLPAVVGAPASRGRACRTTRRGGGTVPLRGCPFTDGRLATALGLAGRSGVVPADACESERDCDAPNALLYDLGTVQQVDAVVWRGCSSCTVELSLDGSSWYAWPGRRKEGGSDAVVTGLPVLARHVRVTGTVFLFWDLREAAVWAHPLLPLLPPLPAAAARPTPAPAAPVLPPLRGLLP